MSTKWIRDRKPATDFDGLLPRMYAAVKLGVEGITCSYRVLAAFALGLSRDAKKLRKTRFDSTGLLRGLDRTALVVGVSPLVAWGVHVAKLVESVTPESDEAILGELLVYAALGDLIAKRGSRGVRRAA